MIDRIDQEMQIWYIRVLLKEEKLINWIDDRKLFNP